MRIKILRVEAREESDVLLLNLKSETFYLPEVHD